MARAFIKDQDPFKTHEVMSTAALSSRGWRIFLTAWILYSIHFATNIVREHYPAFTLAEHGTFFVDEYQDFHSDIFVHPNGHSVIGNQVLVSLLAAVPLFAFDPALDALEQYSKDKLANNGVVGAEYRTDKPMRVAFFRLVKERGLDLRFGAAAFITTAFFMAPLTALFLALFYRVLLRRGMSATTATWLTFLLGFATPLFYRATVLGHNIFLMYGMFIAFVLVWLAPERLPASRIAATGFFAGLTIAVDYMGVLIFALLYGYMLVKSDAMSRAKASAERLSLALRQSLLFGAGALPPLVFLLYSQWVMYGNAFMPGQYWMPKQNVYTEIGMRGFSWPSPDLVLKNLFDPGFGLYSWGPLLLLALIPATYATRDLILPKAERRFAAVCFVSLLLFSSANQYARLQWNSGFRYLLPLLPFMILALSDHWLSLPRWARWLISAIALLHSWVLAAFRELSLQRSWELFFQEGIQLPWLRVLRMTTASEFSTWATQGVSVLILGVTALLIWALWRYGGAHEARQQPLGGSRVAMPSKSGGFEIAP
jgi:hypothetical protein